MDTPYSTAVTLKLVRVILMVRWELEKINLQPAPVRVPNQRPFAPSVTLVTPVAIDKGDNEMIPETVHRSPGICLTAEANPGKPQLGDRLTKGLCNQSSRHMGFLTSK